jgi:hypothetical protein
MLQSTGGLATHHHHLPTKDKRRPTGQTTTETKKRTSNHHHHHQSRAKVNYPIAYRLPFVHSVNVIQVHTYSKKTPLDAYQVRNSLQFCTYFDA